MSKVAGDISARAFPTFAAQYRTERGNGLFWYLAGDFPRSQSGTVLFPVHASGLNAICTKIIPRHADSYRRIIKSGKHENDASCQGWKFKDAKCEGKTKSKRGCEPSCFDDVQQNRGKSSCLGTSTTNTAREPSNIKLGFISRSPPSLAQPLTLPFILSLWVCTGN